MNATPEDFTDQDTEACAASSDGVARQTQQSASPSWVAADSVGGASRPSSRGPSYASGGTHSSRDPLRCENPRWLLRVDVLSVAEPPIRQKERLSPALHFDRMGLAAIGRCAEEVAAFFSLAALAERRPGSPAVRYLLSTNDGRCFLLNLEVVASH